MKTPRPAKRQPPVNMRLVAQKAGVSVTTVSLALRNDPSISHETKERIYKVQHALGYQIKERKRVQPPPSAPLLEKIIYRVEGLSIDEKSYAPFLNGVIEECRNLEIQLELDHAGAEEVKHLLASRDLSRSGVILSGRLKEEQIDQIRRIGVPFVVLGNYRFKVPVHMVGLDLANIAETIVSNLAEKGYTSLLVVLESLHQPFEHRLSCLLKGMLMDRGLPAGDDVFIEAGIDSANIAEATRKVIQRNQPRQAIITTAHCADLLVMELRTGPRKTKYPVEIFALSNNPSKASKRHYHPIDLKHQQCGRLAVMHLMNLVKNPSTPPYQSLVDFPRGFAGPAISES